MSTVDVLLARFAHFNFSFMEGLATEDQDASDTNDRSEIPYFIRLKGYWHENSVGNRVGVFFPSGKPFFLDEDPNSSNTKHLEISCGSNIANIRCYYYGNGD